MFKSLFLFNMQLLKIDIVYKLGNQMKMIQKTHFSTKTQLANSKDQDKLCSLFCGNPFVIE